MILTKMPVPPPPVRPSVSVDGIRRCEDDLSHQLGSIIKSNRSLKKLIKDGSPTVVKNQHVMLLQHNVNCYFDNTKPNQPRSKQKSGKKIKSISERLKGKEGRLRGNMMGKRVDFSGRSVITPDPSLELDEVGVPKSIAMNLTFPDIVNSRNISYLRELVRNGPKVHPGANYIITSEGVQIDLNFSNEINKNIEIGYVVERHLQDGDLVLFNRQPSLHKMSMMGQRVRVLN